ncbi:hypothetical protein IAQ61_009803 [Plenodomus lingam]|uniref:Predicted protein n=1 Tax=Leptosphaeria maculans (strain JN3 / isolate v23.1.3 / race Av1-4-5-6-7-8) TaxID=985895 RepID=E4ZUL1_LEPMJ|nr:predicted protein [Plenodomus lingam JN3]KAH9863525.1 hypothetical protein IAQ61_009803 [Plenodomus lingam]CBX95090.1 predicted protein [Plenodomus lingam JN3]
MSARGARSRKVQQKSIEKTEKKGSLKGKGKSTEISYDSPDAFAQWRVSPSVNDSRNGITRTLTGSSKTSRGTSRSGSTHDGGLTRSRLNTVHSRNSFEERQSPRPASVSDVSSKSNANAKFQTHGKETKAPRGRGGGVPIKKMNTTFSVPPTFRTESTSSQSQSSQNSWASFKIWGRERNEMRPYNGFDLDHDMQTGEVLIHLGGQQFEDDLPVPTIRADLQVLQDSGSTWLTNTLAMGRIEDDDISDWELSNDSGSWLQNELPPPSFNQPKRHKMLRPALPGKTYPQPFANDQGHSGVDSQTTSQAHHLTESAQTEYAISPDLSQWSDDQMTTHQIWFPIPSNIQTMHGQRLHHVAIRNFLAILHGKSIVGADLFEMVDTLQATIVVMYDLDNNQSGLTPQELSIQMITDYLEQHGLDDVRNNVRHALGLLLWSEQDNVRWRQGYLESFVHLAGVMTSEIEELSDFKRLSVVTRRNLGMAGKTLQLRIMEAEERLAGFEFADLWGNDSKIANGPVHRHCQLFRQFLVNHYARIYGSWPPVSGKTWLNRKIVQAMQNDFGSLYDYLVNREVFWNPREERARRKWEMAHRKMDGFQADLPELDITDVLVMFDGKQGYTHIPHPYPLLPIELPKGGKEKEKKGFFSSLKKDKTKETTRDAKAHLQLSIVFSDATNIEKLDVNFNGSTLIDKFEQFELTTDLKHATPRVARLGRWVLLYGILQVLSTLSVDVQGLKHTEGVHYFLCTDLKRVPEWVTNGQLEYLEASQNRSWCWQRAWDPKTAHVPPIELEASLPINRERGATRQEDSYKGDYWVIHSFPSPPPQGALPAPPHTLDSTTSMTNDLRRISKKIDSLSLPHNTTRSTHQDLQLPIQHPHLTADKKEILKSNNFYPPPSTTTSRPPSRLDAQAQHSIQTNPPLRSTSRITHFNPLNTVINTHHIPTEPDYHARHLRSGISSLNTDLGAYPFSHADTVLSLPPHYHESGVGVRGDDSKGAGRAVRRADCKDRESGVLGFGCGFGFEDGDACGRGGVHGDDILGVGSRGGGVG